MRRQQVLLNLGVFVLALVPRVMPTPFHTTDEMSFWLVRSTNFLTALRTGDFIETAQTYHPGVTTMWLGSAGILLIEMVTGQAVADLDLFQYLGLIRLPAAVLHALLITLAYALLLRRLLGEWVALLGTIFWATNLFHIAHSQVLHVDALTTTFVTVAFLAGLVAFHADDEPQAADVRWGWLFASAVFAGLATMTKLTLLYVSAPLGLVALEMREAWLRQPNRWRRLLRYVVLPMALWTVAVGLTCLFVYPALWLGDFATVIERMERGFALATSAHSGGNYFWGEPTSIPGRGFYWVALSMRLSPWVMVGVLVAIVRIFRRGWHGRTTVAALLFYAIGLIILMDLQPKKFDRYLLPIFPVLDFIAAAGLVWIVGITARYPQGVARVPARAAWVSTVGVLALLAAWYHPYALAYYNPVFGGARTAPFALLVGWGEGMEQVAEYIRRNTGDCAQPVTVAAHMDVHLGHYDLGCAEVLPFWDDNGRISTADFLVTYVSQMQRHDGTTIHLLMNSIDRQPARTLTLHGIDYVHIYDLREDQQ